MPLNFPALPADTTDMRRAASGSARVGAAGYAAIIAAGCAVALLTPLWWAAVAAFAVAEAAASRPAPRRRVAAVVELPRRAERARTERAA